MDARIVVAVIGGVFGVVTPIITYVLIQLYNERFLLLLSQGRRKALDGKWQGTLQFGSMMLELTPDGQELKGRFVAYGVLSQRLIYGSIELTKQAEPLYGL